MSEYGGKRLDLQIQSFALEGKTVDTRIMDSVSSVLDESISFVEAKKSLTKVSDQLKSKYHALLSGRIPKTNATYAPKLKKQDSHRYENLDDSFSEESKESKSCDSDSAAVLHGTMKKMADGIAEPKMIIHDRPISLEWQPESEFNSVGLGLHNMGNTCFLNSVLQVLTHTPALVNYVTEEHRNCNSAYQGQVASKLNVCALCELRDHVRAALKDCKRGPFPEPIVPYRIIQRMRHFMKSHIRGRQEDSHEFLRYFIDAMQNACLLPYSSLKLDMFTKGTTAIGNIFGGYHRNEITCMNCNAKSTTYDPFLDISLEVKRLNCIEDALKQFTKQEILCAENAYKCLSCKKSVRARKMYTIHRPPNVLTIQLKRFDHFGKVGQFIKFQEKLDLLPYMSEKTGPHLMYRLYGTIVHQGNSTHSGHYYAFVRNLTGSWHLMDDSRICPVSLKNVLGQPAYLLFYVRQHTQTAAVKPVSKIASSNSATFSPKIPPFSVKPLQQQRAASLNRISESPSPKPLHKVIPFPSQRNNSILNLVRPKPPVSSSCKSQPDLLKKKPLVPYEDDDSSDSSSTPPPVDPKQDTSAKKQAESQLYQGIPPPSKLKRSRSDSPETKNEETLSELKKEVLLQRCSTLSPSNPEAKTQKQKKRSALAEGPVSKLFSEQPFSPAKKYQITSNLDFGSGVGKSVIAEAEAKIKMKINIHKGTVETLTNSLTEEASSFTASDVTEKEMATTTLGEKKKKKKKKNRESSAESQSFEDSTSERKKKKKKRHEADSRGSEEEEEKRKKKKKHKKKHRRESYEEDELKHKEVRSDKESSRGKSSASSSRSGSHDSRKRSHHYEEGQERKRRKGSEAEQHPEDPRSHHYHNERRFEPVAADLFGGLNSTGYGEKVQSWDGGRSKVDEEDAMERRAMALEDRERDDYDRGRTKKFKEKKRMSWAGPHNSFQRFQDHRNGIRRNDW